MLIKIQTPASRRKAAMPQPEPWPPPEYALPADNAAIERGRPEGARIEDHSREGRLRRLMAGVPGVVTANKLPSHA